MTHPPARGARLASVLLVAGLFLTTACSPRPHEGCVETEHPVTDDEMLPVGYTVDELLVLTQPTQAPAKWVDGVESTLTFSMTRDPDSAVWVESAQPEWRQLPWPLNLLNRSPDRVFACDSHLRLPMVLQMQTDDGRLAVTVSTRARSPMYPYVENQAPSLGVDIEAPLASLNGTLDYEAAIGPQELAPTELIGFAYWSEGEAPDGAMHVQFSEGGGDTGWGWGWAADLIYWGDAGYYEEEDYDHPGDD